MLYPAVLTFLFIVLFVTAYFILNKKDRPRKNMRPGYPTKFSVIVPFRNEAFNLPGLLEHLNRIRYPRENFEVIFVNDESTDRSVEILQNTPLNFSYKILHVHPQSASPKKEALQAGINKSVFPCIITLDADTFPPENWLHAVDKACREHPDVQMFIGSVDLRKTNEPFFSFQQTEWYFLQGLTAVSAQAGHPVLANGAHLIFRKKAFEKAGGYKDALNYAGGDDVFLLRKFKKYFPRQIRYLKSPDAIVKTQAPPGFSGWQKQRIRWFKKMWKSADGFTLLSLVILATYYFLLLRLFLQNPVAGLLIYFMLLPPVFLFIRQAGSFFGQKPSLLQTWIFITFAPVFYLWIFIQTLFTRDFKWKGRKFKQ